MPQKYLRSSNTKIKSLRVAENRGSQAVKLFAARLRGDAIAATMDGRQPKIGEALRKFAVSELRDAMIVAHMLALRDSKIRGLKLSSYDKTIGVINRQLKLNIRKLQSKYETDALRIVNDVSEKVDRELRETFLELVQSGAHVTDAREALGQKFDDLGLTEKSGFEIDTIFRTQSQLAYGAGSWEADQDPDIQEILWGYRYSAVGDGRTRPVHAALDGVTLPKDDPFWQTFWPPNGWNCRCTTIQLFSPEPEVYPPDVADDGEPIAPDPGFGFNPGQVFS